jgi:hypothetical protein
MDNIDAYLDELLPSSSYIRRDGPAVYLIDKLSDEDKELVEQAFISKLESGSEDTWIAEYLAYMKSDRSLPLLCNLLEDADAPETKIIYSSCIYSIKPKSDLIQLALSEATKVHDKYSLIGIFYYLTIFNHPDIKRFLNQFINHKDFLIAYNAKRCIKIMNGESDD